MFANFFTLEIIRPFYSARILHMFYICFKTELNKVENVQRRMTKLIPQIRDLEYPERLRILKLPSIAYRRSRVT